MPPILASIIDTLPDYYHDHLVVMTAWMIKNKYLPNKHKNDKLPCKELVKLTSFW